jgi:PhnB protein
VSSEAEADRMFAALGEGGKVGMPLAKTFWSPKFGMLTDRFGVGWMVSVATENA